MLALGSAPLERLPIDPGYYRVVVHVPGVGSAELTRELVPGEDEIFLARIRPTGAEFECHRAPTTGPRFKGGRRPR